jgi:hypothetical protein
MSLTLLMLLGLGLTVGIFNLVRDDDDDDTPPEDDTLPEDQAQTITVVDGDNLTGNDADNTWIGGDISAEFAVSARVDAGDGNDTMRFFGTNALIAGGGNDLIEVGGYGTLVQGEAGDDTIISGENPAGLLYGGSGDDLIDVSVSGWQDETLSAFGDSGNDTLRATVGTFGRDEGSVTALGLFGGEGADVYDITLVPRLGLFDPDAPTPMPGPSLVVGFEPGIDRIEIDTADTDGVLILRAAEMRANAAGGFSDLILSYETPEGQGVDGETLQLEIIRFANTTSVQLSDITLTGLQPAV